MNILYKTALDQSAALANRDISAVELMQETLARIDAVNPAVNAIVSLGDPDDLLARAKAADAAPRTGWLHGMPMAIKDLADVAGMPTSRGSPLFEGEIAQKDSVFVASLRAAGALFIGKTNTPEFGLGSHTFNPVHGVTRNPYDLTRSAGGSSGGAAVALACGMLSVADGSDMMGSLRNPAGWNNVYGMRPTWGLVPGEPVGEMFLHQLATSGPMARNPRDLAALLDTMAGHDPAQPHGFTAAASLPQIDIAPDKLKIGWLGDWGGTLPYEEGIPEVSTAALSQMEGLGHSITDLKAPHPMEAIWEAWVTLRHFAVAGGARPLYENPETRKKLKEAAQWEITQGLALSAMDVQRASEARSDWFRTTTDLFAKLDVLVLPSAQVWPFDADLVHPTQINGIEMDTYHRWMQVVVPAGLLGLPVVNVPAGFGANGLPAGLQLIGPRGSDAKLLQLAQQWHEATDWPNARRPEV